MDDNEYPEDVAKNHISDLHFSEKYFEGGEIVNRNKGYRQN